MTYASNRLDGTRIYFEDDGGEGVPVVLHGGFLDSVADARESSLASSLPTDEFRMIYVDHRGLGRSDKPHEPAAYGLRLRVADAVAVLDELAIARAHFIGMSWGGRLAFGIGEHAPERVLSLVVLGQQPYAWPDSPITRAVTEGLVASRTRGAVGLVEALETFWGVRFPNPRRARWLENDTASLEAAWTTALAEGPVSSDLGAWRVPCLICIGSADADFIDQARRAAAEIPGARFVALSAADHYRAHVSEDEVLREAILDMLRANSRDTRVTRWPRERRHGRSTRSRTGENTSVSPTRRSGSASADWLRSAGADAGEYQTADWLSASLPCSTRAQACAERERGHRQHAHLHRSGWMNSQTQREVRVGLAALAFSAPRGGRRCAPAWRPRQP